jgi:cysteine desulfurase
MGTERPLALGTLRFSLGHETTDADIDRVVAAFPDAVARVRELGAALGRA